MKFVDDDDDDEHITGRHIQ